MKIVEQYSHLNGYEYLLVHMPEVWSEIASAISNVNAASCKTKISKEKTMKGKKLFSPVDLNVKMKQEFEKFGWDQKRVSYWVTKDVQLIKKTLQLPEKEQKEKIEEAGLEPILSYNQTDFVKKRIAVEVQFGKYAFVAYDLFVKHMAFFIGDIIDVGIEILPMKSLQKEMSSGVPYYEGALYDLIRQGRSVPAVPLVLIGVAS